MVKLSDIELPMIFPNRLLFSYGILNNWEIKAEEIAKSLDNTNWDDQRTRSLFFAHNDRDAQKWVGRIANPHVVGGELFGDLEIMDADLAMKLGPGKAPLGISAEIKWSQQYNQPTDFSYRAFAVVHNPEVTNTLVNFSKKDNDSGFTTATFQVPFQDTTNFSDEGVVTSTSAQGTIINKDEDEDSSAEFSNKNAEEKTDLMSAERGLNKIKMEEKQNNEIPKEDESMKEDTKVEADIEESEEPAKDLEDLIKRVSFLETKFAEFSESKEAEEVEAEEVEAEAEEVEAESKESDFSEEEVESEEVEAEEVEAESKESDFSEEEVESEEVKSEEVKSEEAKEADFSEELVKKIGELVEVIGKKEAAPMSTAEFGNKGIDRNNAVIDRLTLELQK